MKADRSPSQARFHDVLKPFLSAMLTGRRRQLAKAITLILAAGVLEGFRLAMLVPIIETLDPGAANGAAAGLFRRTLGAHGLAASGAMVPLLVAAFLIVSSLRATVVYLRDRATLRIQTDLVSAERSRLMRLIAEAPWSRIVQLDHAEISNLVSVEAQKVGSSAQLLLNLVSSLAMLAIQTALALLLSPRLAIATLLVLAIGAAVTIVRQRRAVALGERFTQANRAMMATTGRFLSGLKAAIAQGAQGDFVSEFDRVQDDVRTLQFDFLLSRSYRALWLTIGGTVAAVAIVLIGVEGVGVRLSVLLTVMFIFFRMSGPAIQIYSAIQSLAFALPGANALLRLRGELESEASARPAPRDMEAVFDGAIEMRSVRYIHPSGRGIRNASIVIGRGEFVGVMGPSGHGKTTFIDLVAGLLIRQSGEIRVAGETVFGEHDHRQRRGRLAYVTQEATLFNDTLRRNLSWTNDGAGDAELIDALETVGGGPLLRRLGGLDAMLGERGAMLSGGERQRIAIARALLRRPQLLLLDEATSAIDAESEADVLGRLADLGSRPTILLVSHRRESMRRCDRVVFVRDGELIDAGNDLGDEELGETQSEIPIAFDRLGRGNMRRP